MQTVRNLAAASVALVALASAAQAQITQTGTVGSTATTASLNTNSGTVSVNKFNSALGTLNSVVFKIDGTLVSSATVSNAASANGSANINTLVVSGKIKLTDTLGDSLVQAFPTSYVVGDGLTPPYVGQTFLNSSPQSIAPGATFNSGSLTALASVSKTYTSANGAGILALFTGNSTDTISLFTAGTASNVVDISGGNTSSGQNSSYSAGISVVYNYTPTVSAAPEASSLVFGMIGVVGIVVRARRRTAK